MPKVKSSKVEEGKNGQVERKEEEEKEQWSAVSGWLVVGVKKRSVKYTETIRPFSSFHNLVNVKKIRFYVHVPLIGGQRRCSV